VIQLTSRQQAILDVVSNYPGQFSRSGLAKMLVGAKSWQNADFPDYGRFSAHRRQDITYQIEILIQQGFIDDSVDGRLTLTPPSNKNP
jgi:hypothetical protein